MNRVTVTRPAWWKIAAIAFGIALLVLGCGTGFHDRAGPAGRHHVPVSQHQ